MRTLLVLITLLPAVVGCSNSPPSPSTRDRPLPSGRFPPGMGPKAAPKNS